MGFVSEQLRILQAAKGSTALLGLATVDLAYHALSEVERTRIKDALLVAAVPHWCDNGFLAALLESTPEESGRLLGQLQALTVVESFPARGEHAVNVHEATRLALREHLRTTDAMRWKALSTRARAYVAQGTEPHARIEALYHLFAIDQTAAAAESEKLDRECDRLASREFRHALALALQELAATGWLTGSAQVEALLTPLEIRNIRGESAQLEEETRNVAKLARTVSHLPGIGRSNGLLGSILRTKGHLDDALTAYRESLAIFQRLASTNPSNAIWQRDLAVVHTTIGDIAQTQGRLDDALAGFHESLAIFQRLASSDPSNADWQSNLARAHARVGTLAQIHGRLDDALAAFHESHTICQRLASSDPSNADWQRDLALAHARLGILAQTQDRLDDASTAYQESLTICQRLASSDPSNANWQRDLALAHDRVGTLAQTQGRLDDALAAFYKSLAISQRLASSDPSNADWQSNLALAHDRVGELAQIQGRLDEALTAYQESLTIYQTLGSSDPSNANWQHDLALAHYNFGRTYKKMGNEEEGQASFEAAVDIMEQATTMSSENMAWEKDLSNLKSWLTSQSSRGSIPS